MKEVKLTTKTGLKLRMTKQDELVEVFINGELKVSLPQRELADAFIFAAKCRKYMTREDFSELAHAALMQVLETPMDDYTFTCRSGRVIRHVTYRDRMEFFDGEVRMLIVNISEKGSIAEKFIEKFGIEDATDMAYKLAKRTLEILQG